MELDFLQEYFIKPIMNPEIQGYNLINTSIYILLLVISCIGIYFLLRKKINFDEEFFLSLTPYILFGVSARVIMHQIEAGLISIEFITKTANPFEIGFWFFTPGIWIATFTLTCAGLIFSGAYKKINYKIFALFGIIFALPLIFFNFIQFNNWTAFIATSILIAAVSFATIKFVQKFTNYDIMGEKLNQLIVFGQAIDGIASAVAIEFFNFSEQHVVSGMVMNIHPALFAIIKIVLAVLICWSLDEYFKEEITKAKMPGKTIELKNKVEFVKIIIAILGFATGLASLFKLGLI